MPKSLLALVLALVLAGGGYFGFQEYQTIQAQRAAKAHAAAAAAAEAARVRAQQAANDATRKDVESQLKPLKVTSIMPGQPGLVIIDKKPYAEGDPLPLKGKALKITAVREDGVLLAYNGLSFRLDPPAAPDLDALRGKK